MNDDDDDDESESESTSGSPNSSQSPNSKLHHQTLEAEVAAGNSSWSSHSCCKRSAAYLPLPFAGLGPSPEHPGLARRLFYLLLLAAVVGLSMLAVWIPKSSLWPIPDRGSSTSVGSQGLDEEARKMSPLPGIELQPSGNSLPGMETAAVEGASSAFLAYPEVHEVDQVPRVSFAVDVNNINFALLRQSPETEATLISSVQQAVTTIALNDLREEQVKVSLQGDGFEPHRTQVDIYIPLSSASQAVAVGDALRGDYDRFSNELGLNLAALQRLGAFKEVSSGPLKVEMISIPAISGTTLASTSTITTTAKGWTSTRTTTTVTTTENRCLPLQYPCFIDSQCCSSRCISTHRCGPSLSWV